jgi:hypothetical protein
VCGVRTDGHRVGLGLRGYFPPALVLPVALVESSRVQAVEMIHRLHTRAHPTPHTTHSAPLAATSTSHQVPCNHAWPVNSNF